MIPVGPLLYLILLAAKYRDGWTIENEEEEKEFVRESLKPFGGLDYKQTEPQRRKPKLRVVK